MNLVRRTDTTRPVASSSLPLLKRTIHPHVNRHTVRILKGVTVLPHGVARPSRFQRDRNRHRHSKESMEIFVPNVNTLARHLPGDKIDGMSAGRCQKPRKHGTIRRLAREVKKQVQGTSRLTWSARKVEESTRAQRRLQTQRP